MAGEPAGTPQVVATSRATSVAGTWSAAGSGMVCPSGITLSATTVPDELVLSCGIVNLAPFSVNVLPAAVAVPGVIPASLNAFSDRLPPFGPSMSNSPANEVAPSVVMPRLFIAEVKLVAVAPVTGTTSRKSIAVLYRLPTEDPSVPTTVTCSTCGPAVRCTPPRNTYAAEAAAVYSSSGLAAVLARLISADAGSRSSRTDP